jgi:hypothetical protein
MRSSGVVVLLICKIWKQIKIIAAFKIINICEIIIEYMRTFNSFSKQISNKRIIEKSLIIQIKSNKHIEKFYNDEY